MSPDKKFLDSLKPGDLVAVRDRRLGGAFSRSFGYRRYKVVKITPTRKRFDLVRMTKTTAGDLVPVEPQEVVEFKEGYHVVGGGFSREVFSIEPFTDLVEQSILDDNVRQNFHNLSYDLEEDCRAIRSTESMAKLTLDQMKEFNAMARKVRSFIAGMAAEKSED